MFPPHQQPQIRSQLANSVQAIIAQRLLPLRDGSGRIAAHEVLIRNVAIANLIREGKSEQIFSQLQTGKEEGMQTMDDALQAAVQAGKVTAEDAAKKALDRSRFEGTG